MQLISETLKSALCEQLSHEFYNANLYLYICGYLRNKGLDNIAKLFEEQHKEETSHGLEFFNLLTDLNTDVIIPEIAEIAIAINTIGDVAKLYLEREILTTNSINEIRIMAMAESCPVVEEKMRHMISLQQKEYEEATSFADKAELLSEWWQVAIYDASLGK